MLKLLHCCFLLSLFQIKTYIRFHLRMPDSCCLIVEYYAFRNFAKFLSISDRDRGTLQGVKKLHLNSKEGSTLYMNVSVYPDASYSYLVSEHK